MAFDKIIVLDDELIIRKTLEQQLRRKHYTVASATTLAEAENLLAKDHFDLMFVDVRLPDGDGTQLLERCSDDPDAPMVVIITGYGSIESAVECMRRGAFDYIVKPCSMDEIEVILKKAESYRQLVRVNQYFSSEAASESEIIGSSPTMVHLRTMIKKVAATEATVLITGENGTGKELVAGELYRSSPLVGRPFIKVNCAAISETLIESEFFGHEKGAFTGATQRREGRFELANNGTILLDEISEISPSLQAKLLRVLQEKEFERVGGNRTIQVNVRVIATTNRNLIKAVEKGDFREDLFYRLNVFPLTVPPLRERKEDIKVLAETFLERFCRKHGTKIKGFQKQTMSLLLEHDWPGNVRELQNTIERAVILSESGQLIAPQTLGLMPMTQLKRSADSSITPAFFPTPQAPAGQDATAALQKAETEAETTGAPADATTGINAPEPTSSGADSAKVQTTKPNLGEGANGTSFPSLQELEKQHILDALEKTNGKRSEAADLLNISTRTLRNKINQYRLEGVDVP